MDIRSEHLNRYIHSNTTNITRKRGEQVVVKNLSFAEGRTSAQAIVLGSQGVKYVVNFENISSNKISSSCTCPFDWGNVCKHEVATALDIDRHLYNDTNTGMIQPTNILKTKTTSNGEIEVPFTNVQDITTKFIITHAGVSVYNNISRKLDSYVIIEDHTSEYISLTVGTYYKNDHVVITPKKNILSLRCTCKKQHSSLCQHQAMSLLYIANNTPFLLLSKEELDLLKEKKLNEFGFSLEDESYKQYFDFSKNEEGVELLLKKNGIVRMSKYGDFDVILDELIEGENVIKKDLPYKENNSKKNKQKGIAIGFYFGSDEYDEPPVLVTPLIGNLNKDKTELTTKIEAITPQELIYNDYNLNKENKELLQVAFNLSQERIEELSFHPDQNDDSLKTEKHIFTHLKKLLSMLENTPRYQTTDFWKISKKSLVHISFKMEPTDLVFNVTEEGHFYLLKASVIIEGRKHKLTNSSFADNFFFIHYNDHYYFNKSVSYAKALQFFRKNPEIRINKSDFAGYHKKFIKPLAKKYEVTIAHLKKKKKKKDIATEEIKKQLYLSDLGGFILLKPILAYKDQQIEVLSNETFEERKNTTIYSIKRDEVFEQEFIEIIKGLHSDFQKQNQSFYYLSPDEFLKDTWFIDAFETLDNKNISVFGFDTLSGIKYNKNKPTMSVKVASGLDWFDVNMDVSFGNQQVSLKELKKVVMNKSRYVELKDGSIGILPEKWLEKYTHLFRSGDVQKDKIAVSKYQLSVIDSLYDELDSDTEFLKNHVAIKQKLKSFKEISKIKEPKGITAKLRNYQKEGLNWLNFLDEYNFGGCLADDMGLGKTLQIITFFKHLKNDKKNKSAHLVILPTSLIFNWKEEIKKFCPTLKILVLSGGDRSKTTKGFDKYDLILTTYGIAIRDISYLKDYTFHYIVLDESQAIKNPASKRFKTVRLLQASNRLVLTGTPIENNTFDLYAQMTFVNPGMLGNIASFKNEYANRIDKNKETQVAKELQQLISPFLLRRTKEQVATELPSKTEQTLYCTMDTEQQKLYDAYKNKYRDYLLGKIEEDGLGKSKMYVLEGLTKLRQICDSPSLLNEDEIYTTESIKVQELLKHITEKTGNHKILVFSQFVKMLHLIEDEFKKEGINYEYLDGKTKNRQEKVERFQNDDQVRVFLISLKAGGTGLNLTAADYVYLVDPWWNPAVEAQAIDRCYRIGQTKKVMAYKMICKGTIEEKIIEHQQTKKKLSADIIQTDESFVKELSKESIVELFS